MRQGECSHPSHQLLPQNPSNNLGAAGDAGESFFSAIDLVEEIVVVQTQCSKNGGVKITEVGWLVAGHQAEFIGGADADATLDSAARQPDGEPCRIVLTATVALHHRRTAKLAGPDDQGGIK